MKTSVLDVLLQCDKVWSHTSLLTVQNIQYIKFECLKHPPYSLDFSLSDFYEFGQLEEAMGGQVFQKWRTRGEILGAQVVSHD